jgi:hypothetical protein
MPESSRGSRSQNALTLPAAWPRVRRRPPGAMSQPGEPGAVARSALAPLAADRVQAPAFWPVRATSRQR